MFADYQRLIIQDFEKKKAGQTLSLRLTHPTPAKLKQECIEVCATRFEKKDETTIKAFFGEQDDAKSYVKAIDRCDIDKFRPMVNFLKGHTSNPDTRNIELLAWLINFEPRPWEFGKDYDPDNLGNLNEGTSNTRNKEGWTNESGDVIKPGIRRAETLKVFGINQDTSRDRAKGKGRKITAILVIIVLLCISTYLFWKTKAARSGLRGHEACMYWNGDHYEQISCSKKLSDALVVALDSVKIRNFKRIMNPDTITYNSKGKVWYIKINGKLEYYTSSGKHPLNPNLILRPISEHIIRTYILPDSVK